MEKISNLTKFRRKRKLCINELADRVGVSGACICRYEKGARKMPVETAKKIAEVLRVSWWRLYD